MQFQFSTPLLAMIELTEIRDARDLATIRKEWEVLVDGSSSRNLFLAYDWISIWLSHFWNDKPILFLLIKEHGEPLGLAPFLEDHKSECLVFPINGHSHRPNVIARHDDAFAWDATFRHLGDRYPKTKLYLEGVAYDQPMSSKLPTILKNHGFVVIHEKGISSPFLTIAGDWDAYLASKSAHFRGEMKRKLNRIRKAGTVDLVKVTTRDECDSAMEDVFTIERNSWKEKEGSSFTAEKGLKEFYLDVARQFAEKGWLSLYLLYFNAQPVAHVFCVIYKNCLFALKTSYHEGHKDLSPGVVIFSHMLRDCFESKLDEIDFLGVESRWKNEITSEKRDHANLHIYPRNVLSLCQRFYENSCKPFVRDKAPFIPELKKRLRQTVLKR